MATVPKILFRLILAGLVAAGCVLFWLSAARNGRNGGRPAERVAAAGANSAPHEGVAQGSAETAEAATATAQREAPAPAEAASASENGKGAADEGPQPVTLKGFTYSIYGDKDRPEAEIEGKEARYWDREKLYDIVAPIILATVRSSATKEGVDVQLRKVRLTAERAKLLGGEDVVYLYDKVHAESEDLAISTGNVTYQASKHRLESDAELLLQRYRTDSSGQKALSMEVTGKGFSLDLTLKKIVVRKEPVAKLFSVSGDFLAGEGKLSAREGSAEDVVLTGRGRLIYEHPARTVTFTGGVRVTFGDKTLRCDRLVLSVGESNKKARMGITNMIASGHVEFTCGDQQARGERLEWQTVTQMCELTGKGATLRTSEFAIQADQLSFFRMNSRFQVVGAGTMLWAGADTNAQSPAAEGEAPPAERTLGLGGLRFDQGRPVEVTWLESMTYDRTENRALFKGSVRVSQQEDYLSAETLAIEFDAGNEQLTRMTAQGNVKLSGLSADSQQESVCELAVWDAANRALSLSSPGGQTVLKLGGGQKLVSRDVVLYPGQDRLSCPGGGSMTLPSADEGEGKTGPVSVEWKKSMQFERGEKATALFEGEVKARGGGQKISSESLEVNFDANMKPVKITATGDAVLEARQSEPAAKSDESQQSPGDDGGHESSGEEPLSLSQLAGERSALRISCPELVIEPPQGMLHCTGAGMAELLGENGVTDSIRWKERMRASTLENSAYFEGDVEARVRGATLLSKKLRVDFDRNGELRHIKADEEVEFSNAGEGSWQLRCGSAEAFFILRSRLREMVARHAVRVADAERTLRADLLHLFFDTESEGNPTLTRAIARGGVSMSYDISPKITATGDELQWDRAGDMYVLTGAPYAELRRGLHTTRSGRISLDRTTGKRLLPQGTTPVESGG